MNSPVMFLTCLMLWLSELATAIRVPVSYNDTPTSCPGPTPSKVVLCYYEGHLPLQKLDPCLCSHFIFTSAATINPTNYTLNLKTDVGKATGELRRRNPELQVLVSVGGERVPTEVAEALVKSAERRAAFASSVARSIRDADMNGIEISFRLDAKGGSKNSKAGLLALTRRYGIRDARKVESATRLPHRTILRSARTDTDSHAREMLRQRYMALEQRTPKNILLLINVPIQPEILVKRFDLKTLTKYVDYFTIPTHNLTDYSESGVTYHPSRLMGLADILNTDSLLDLLTGLGAPHNKLIISIPATVAQFTLKDSDQNTPRSPVMAGPETLTQTELCALMSAGGWTIERDEDLTAPYAFKNDTWLAFDDRISVGIKSKYVLLRDLAGAALYPVDSADWSGSCLEENGTDSKAPRLLHSLYHAFTSLTRKSRGALLETLQEDIRTSTLLTFSGDVHLSPYRIVRVIDNLGAVHVVRKDARTEFECSRQGYFRHPLGCNRFYRCVKFNQYSADFTVFEYDCPAGLAFDERWEVCVWPGSLPERACQGSSEIAPVPRARYACPAAEGYYADPENCRWFFACLDHARDGITPLTAYEFRCPFGLVFDEQNLLCQWPWLVDGCGNSGTFAGAYFGAVAFGDAARRGYVATARTEYGAGDVAGSVLVTASDSGVHSGVGIASGGSTTVIQHGAGHDVGRVPLKHTNFHSNAVTSSSYIAGASRGSVKYSSTSTLGGGFDGQIASSYIAGGRSGASFGNADSYNEGRHISSYASLPDSYISGGRIENSGGLVLGEHVGIHAIGTGFGIRSGGSSVISGGKAAGITTASDNAALNENSYGARTLFSSGTAHGNEGGQFSGGVLSSVPIQSVVETQNSPVLPVVTLKKPAVTQIPIVQPTIVPATAYQQTVVETAQAPVVPVTTFRRPVTQKVPVVQPAAVPVAQAVPVTTYQETVVGTPQVPVVSVTTFRRPAIQKVPLVQPAAVSVAQAVPVTTYQQTVVETPQAPDVPITTFRRPTIEKVPVVQPAAVPVPQAVPMTAYQQTVVETAQAPVVPVTTFRRPAIEKVPVVQPAAVPVAQAVPVTAYQQTVVETPQAPVVPITTFRRPAIEKVPVVQPAAVPVAQAVPVTAYQQTVVETPQAPVVPITTFRRPTIEKVPVVQPAAVPVAQAVPATAYQQTVVETPQAPVVPVTTFRRPAIEKVPVVQPAAVPVAQAVPATAYQQAVVESPQAPVVPITTFKRPAIEKVPVVQPAAVPVAQAVPVTAYQQTVVEIPQAPVVPVTTFRRPAIEKLPVAQTVPVTTYRQKVAEISTRTKLRPVSPQVPAVHVTKPVAPVVNTYLSTPAPAVVAIQSEFSEAHGAGFVTGGDAGVGNSFQGRPAVSVATNGAAGISVPLVRPNVETSGVVVTTNAVPLTSVPGIETGVSSGGYSYSTPATTIDTSGSISVTSIPSYSPSGYVSSTSAPAIFSGSSIPETPVIKSGTATADYSYSTPATAIFTGKSVSVTPVSALKLHTSSGSYSFTTPASTIKFNVPTAGHSYPAPAPTTVTSGAASINVASPVRTNVESHTVPSSGIVSGDTAVLVNTRISPTVGYSQPKSSTAFITGKAASFRGVSLASGLEPAVFDSSAGIASGLEIPSSTPGSTFVASGVTRRPYTTRVGATTLVVPPTSNIKISNIQENGYVPSSVTVTPDISIPKGYTLNRKALLSSTAAPIHSVSFVDGDFGARTSYQNGESVAPYPGAVAKEEFIPQINLTYGAHPAKVYTTGSAFITSSISGTGRTQGQGSTYSDHVSGYVSSAPIPLTSTSGSSVIYSSSPRPTAFQVPSSAPYTLKPVTYTVDATSKSAETVSTSAPVTTAAYLSPAPVLQSVPSNYENLEGFGSRISQSASGRKSTSKTRINYDNENVEALLDKYSGKFGGLLDNNKEGFISGVINDDLVGHSRGRVSQRGRGDVFQRERVDNVRLSGIYGGYSTTAGYSDEGSSTVFGTRAGFADTPATASPSMGELRGKVRYSANTNTDADGGIGYDTVAVEHKGTKLQSKEAPVVVITRLSDINPLLIAKLGAQCTCKSNTVTLKRPVGYTRDGSASKSASISSNIFDDDIISRSGTYSIPEHIPLAPLPGSNLVTGSSPDIILGLGDEISSTAPPGLAPVSLATPRTNEFFQAIGLEEVGVTPTVLVATSRVRNKSTGVTYAAAKPVEISSPVPFSNGVRLRARPQVVSTPLLPLAEVRTPTPSTTDVRAHKRPLTPVVVSTTAVPVTVTEVPDFKRVAAVSGGYPEAGLPGSGVAVSESARGLDVGTDGSVSGAGLHSTAQVGIGAGRAFDRYGPGGWRGLDETLQGSVDCQRAGLFRHPKYCNKFYACYWDEWKRRYTLHVFNCPVHLAYDSSLGACNWPSKGPACSDDNLLV